MTVLASPASQAAPESPFLAIACDLNSAQNAYAYTLSNMRTHCRIHTHLRYLNDARPTLMKQVKKEKFVAGKMVKDRNEPAKVCSGLACSPRACDHSVSWLVPVVRTCED